MPKTMMRKRKGRKHMMSEEEMEKMMKSSGNGPPSRKRKPGSRPAYGGAGGHQGAVSVPKSRKRGQIKKGKPLPPRKKPVRSKWQSV